MNKAMLRVSALILVLTLLGTLTVSACAETQADTILTAGTTQAFSDEPVPEEDVRTILQAGLASESAINQQPWFLVAITDQDVMAELSASGGMPGGAMPSAPKDGAMPAAPQGGASVAMGGGGAKAALGDSPLAIIIYKNENTASPDPDFDCGLAAQNMYLAAVSLGYGAKIISSPTMTLNGADHDAICEKLGVDPSLTAVAVLLVGKKDESVDGATGASVRADLSEKAVIIG